MDLTPVWKTGGWRMLAGVRFLLLPPIDRHTKRIYNVVMYKIEWKDTAGRGCVEAVKNLSDALAFAKELGIPVIINGGGMEIVGVFGADEVKDGLLPNGDKYSWYKRRRPNA